MLKNMLGLSDEGYKNLNKAIIACIVTHIASFLPFAILIQAIIVIVEAAGPGNFLDTTSLWMLAGCGVIAALLHAGAYAMEYDKTYASSFKEAADMRIKIAEHLRRLPLSFFNRKDIVEITTNIMGDCSTIESMMSHTVPQLISTCVAVTLICLMLALYDWRMALALFCALPLSLATIVISRKIQARYGEKHVLARLNASDRVQEYLEGIKEVKAFGMAGEKAVELDRSLRRMMKMSIILEGIIGSLATLAQMFLQVGIGLVILVGVILLTGGSLSLVKFLAFALISARVFAPLITVLTLLPLTIYMLQSIKRMKLMRDEKTMDGDTEAELTSFDIEFKDVSFAYNEYKVLKKASFTIPANSVTALVGPSGSGKSTVLRLIARFWDVDSGTVCIGGKNIRAIDPERLMSYMSFVFQDVVLFDDTILNNIRIGKNSASDEEVYNAARLARCEEFIHKMPDQYQTVIGENGVTLSGGERQRISIARALLKNAPIVLLDEATAFLDPENETLIQAAINELVRGRTVIVIAHRLRIVVNARKILVLEKGELVEQGPPQELFAQPGLFSRLYQIQQNSLGWTIPPSTPG